PGVRDRHLVRPHRAGEDAEGHHREAPRRRREGAALARGGGPPREAGRGAGRKHAGRIRAAPRKGAEDLGEGREGLGREGRMMRATTQLRNLIARGPTLYVPGCYNAVSARVLEAAGFEAIYMTGYGTSLSLTGLPDVGLTTMSEMVANARYIAASVRV